MDGDHDERGAWRPTCARPTDLVVPVRVGRHGADGLTWRVANGPRYERVAHGFYVPVDRSRSVEQRILEAAAGLPADGSGGCVTGWAALRWRGAAYFDGREPWGRGEVPVEILSPLVRHRNRPGVVFHERHWARPETVGGLPLAPVQRALFDEIHTRDELWSAVTAIDMTAAAGLTSVWLFATYVGVCNSRNGAPLARDAVSLGVDECLSPREPWFRLCWVLVAGLDPPLVNRPVYDLRGGLIGVPDLFDPVAGLAGEYAGEIHRSRARHAKDVAREELFRDHGIECVTAVAGDSRETVARRILAARSRARFLAPDERTWTLEPPPWVRVPETLDDRLARLGLVGHLTSI